MSTAEFRHRRDLSRPTRTGTGGSQMKVADRLRIVNPAKAPAEPKAEPAQAADPDTALIPGLERVV